MNLKAGYAQTDITPQAPCALAGYDFPLREFSGRPEDVHDPLLARALVLRESDGPPLVLASLDLAALTTPVADAIRDRIREDCGIPRDRIILACSHTHSAPFVELPDEDAPGASSAPRLVAANQAATNHAYGRKVVRAVREAVFRASGLVYPVYPWWRQAAMELGYNRRIATADGVRVCWNPQEYPERVPQPSPDPTCTALLLRQANGSRSFLLWSIGMHGVVLGKTSAVVSADWPGQACRYLETEVDDCRCLFVQGASGEVHPWIATQEATKHLRTVGNAAGASVALMVQAARLVHTDRRPFLASSESAIRLGETTVYVTVWRIGSIHLVALPVELFATLARRIRDRTADPLVIATLANGWEGYWPDTAAFGEGGYEAEAAVRSGRKPGDGEALADGIVSVLRNP